MGIFRDSWGLRPWVVGVGVIAFILTGLYLLTLWAANATYKGDQVTCTRVGEMTQLPTKMVGNKWVHECYIRVNDQWIPVNNWRVN